MARIFTTPDLETAAKIFMHNVTVAGGINTKNLHKGSPWFLSSANYITAAQTICNELVNRDFADIDQAINTISKFSFYPNYDSSGKSRFLKPEVVAKAIVYFAELLGLYWDDTIRTPYEIAEFKKTLLGEKVYKYGRYISAITTKKASTSASAAGGAKQAPQNGYKQSGPQSGNVRDLKGQPGDKVTAETSLIYKIIGDNPSIKNTPTVFINPISPSGATGTTNKVKIGSGNGYTDCTCYFDDPNEAQAFLDRIVQNNRVPANISNLRVVKMKADPNGYFLVGTEFGVVAVSAKTLNEALTESAKEVQEELSGWEKATKGYSKEELNELHTWMRRD